MYTKTADRMGHRFALDGNALLLSKLGAVPLIEK